MFLFRTFVGLVSCGLVLVFSVGPVHAVDVRSAFKVPVTFYDFHEDGTSPAFEASPTGCTVSHELYTKWPGLVNTTLGVSKVPAVKTGLGADTINCTAFTDLDRWFKTWQSGIICSKWFPGDTVQMVIDSIPFVSDGDTLFWTPVESTVVLLPETLKTDTCYKNITIADSLLFVQFPDTNGGVVTSYFMLRANNAISNDDFFPLDTRGFEALGYPRTFELSWANHNYSFTMELHNQIVYHTGDKMYVRGDDDIWVYINNHLASDMGGLHAPSSDTVLLDNLGLTNNQTYDFDLFFAERHTGGSNLFVRTTCQFVNKTTTTSDLDLPIPVGVQSRSALQSNQGLFSLGNGTSIAVPAGTKNLTFVTFTATGKVVSQKIISIDQKYSNTASLPTGIYFMKVYCIDSYGRRSLLPTIPKMVVVH